MCGIAGFFSLGLKEEDQHSLIRRMLSAIAYRGPDESGYILVNDRNGGRSHGLGNVRLSIVDLEHGQQPMVSADGRYVLTFNGEVFNHIELRLLLQQEGVTFQTRSDTEVLLYALGRWGISALQRIDGQFAFAYYDKLENSVIFARDPAGERPLFYCNHKGGYLFGSEIKAIFANTLVSREFDRHAIAHVANYWTTLPNESVFKEIKSVPPGHYMKVDSNGYVIQPYWSLLESGPKTSASLDDIRNVLRSSLKRRLRADVPVGVYLSGGLDSSIVTHMAAQESPSKLRSYSVAFKDDAFDESYYQQLLAAKLETDHTTITIDGTDILNNFQEALFHAETIVFRTAFVPLLLLAKQVAKDGIKVVLTGEGADEIFLGYDIFKEASIRLKWNDFENDQQKMAAFAKIYPYLSQFSPTQVSQVMGFYAGCQNTKYPDLFSHIPRFTNGRYAARFFLPPEVLEDALLPLQEWLLNRYAGIGERHLLEKAQAIEWETLLSGYLLSTQADRMTSAASIEGRCPFLSPDVIRLANSLVIEQRLHPEYGEKYLLKQAFRDSLPQAISRRPKQPYRAPDSVCFLGSLSPEWVSSLFSEENLRQSSVVEPTKCRALIDVLSRKPEKNLSAREDAAFLMVLSTLELERQFVNGQALSGRDTLRNIKTCDVLLR